MHTFLRDMAKGLERDSGFRASGFRIWLLGLGLALSIQVVLLFMASGTVPKGHPNSQNRELYDALTSTIEDQNWTLKLNLWPQTLQNSRL